MSSADSYFTTDRAQRKNKDLYDLYSLYRNLGHSKRSISLGVGLLLVNSIVVIISSRLMGEFVQRGLVQSQASVAWILALIILGLEGFAVLCYWRGRLILAKGATNALLEVRKKVFDHLSNICLSSLDRQPQGRIVTRMTHDIEGMEQFFTTGLGRLAEAGLMFTLAFMAMLLTSPSLGFVMAISALPAVFLTLYSQRYVRELNRNLSAESSATNAKLAEFINGMPVIYGLGLTKWSTSAYAQQVYRLKKSLISANNFYTWNRPLITFSCYLPMMVLLVWGPFLYQSNKLSLALFVAFIRYCERFINPLINLAREFHEIQQAITNAERVVQFLKLPVEKDQLAQGNFSPTKVQGSIDFNNVWMGYSAQESILKDINFSIQAGEKVGLVGRTGSGKTTTVNLLTRLYEFQTGSILVDGIDIRQWKRQSLREHIGHITQDNYLFKGSIQDNLSNQHKPSWEEIYQMSCNTGLLQTLEKNGLDLNYQLNDGGNNISSGQRQLLAITRTLLQNPSLIVMDEATSHIDEQYEAIIHYCVFELMKNKTCLIIAHRLDTLKACDRLLVFDQGRLVEQGNHQELLKKEGHFYKLSQMARQASP